MTDEAKPSSEWEYPHAVNESDKLVFYEGEEYKERWQITRLDDEMVHARRLDDRRDSADETDSWPHDSLNRALADGSAKRESDGKGQELATY